MKVLTLKVRTVSDINRRYKKCVIPQLSGPVLLMYSHYVHDYNIEILGELCTTVNGIANYTLFYVENYLHQLEIWREKESKYEEKSDPPEWNTNIVMTNTHNIKLIQLASVFSGDFSLPLLAFLFQVFAMFCTKFNIELTSEAFFSFLLLL